MSFIENDAVETVKIFGSGPSADKKYEAYQRSLILMGEEGERNLGRMALHGQTVLFPQTEYTVPIDS